MSSVIQCNLSCNLSCNFFEDGVTSALRETLRRVVYRVIDKLPAKQFTSAVSESPILVLFAAVEASWGFVRFTMCYTTYFSMKLVMPFSRTLLDRLRERLHCIALARLSHEHKCLPG